MTLDDEGFFLELIALTGWGNTAADYRRMLHYEPGGCFVATIEGARVGMVNSTLYGEAGWPGFGQLSREWTYKLWKKALSFAWLTPEFLL